MRLITYYNRYMISLMTVFFIVSGVFSYFSIKQVLFDELDESLLKEMTSINKFVERENVVPTINSFNNDKILFQLTPKRFLEPYFTTFIKPNHKSGSDIYRKLQFISIIKHQYYLVSISNELEGTKHMFRLVFVSTSLTILFLIISILILNSVITAKLWKPFYQTLEKIRDFKINQPSLPHFPSTQVVEFNLMINSLNIATSNAVENFRILREFTENASHEIQTPLSIIRSKLDLLIQHEGLNEKEINSLRSAYGAIKKLSLLNKDLLLITKIENHQFENKEKINLLKVIEDKIIEFKEIWDVKEIELISDLHHSQIMASKDLMEILINNLLSNAAKHNHFSGIIEIYLTENQLKISNTGPDYALDQKQIFTRFYKVDNHNENNGLGLSISKQICEVSELAISYQFKEGMHSFILQWD